MNYATRLINSADENTNFTQFAIVVLDNKFAEVLARLLGSESIEEQRFLR